MKQKTKKASILAFTLIMMGILLAAGLSLMGATIVDQKVALESGNSIQALQNAESGTEVAVSVLSGNFATDPNKDQLSEVFQDHGFICSGNEVAESDYTLTFYDKDENQLDCTDDIADAESVKSVGTNQNTTRAVQVALAAGCAGDFCPILAGGGSSCNINNIQDKINGTEVFFTAAKCMDNPRTTTLVGVSNWVHNNFSMEATLGGVYGTGTTTENGYKKFMCTGTSSPPGYSNNTAYMVSQMGNGTTIPVKCNDGWILYAPGYLSGF